MPVATNETTGHGSDRAGWGRRVPAAVVVEGPPERSEGEFRLRNSAAVPALSLAVSNGGPAQRLRRHS